MDLRPSGFGGLISRLWQPAANFGSCLLRLQNCAIRQPAFCGIGRLRSALWGIARSCSNGFLDSESATLEGIGELQMQANTVELWQGPSDR